jgi:hypothetical protein
MAYKTNNFCDVALWPLLMASFLYGGIVLLNKKEKNKLGKCKVNHNS